MLQKILVILSFLFLSLQAFSSSSAVLDLNSQQEKIILDRLNDICGDTWCEGEYNLIFTSAQFQENEKQHYKISLLAQESYNANSPQRSIVCKVENVELIQNIIFNVLRSQYDPRETELFNLIDGCLAENLSSK